MAVRSGHRYPVTEDDVEEVLWLLEDGCTQREVANWLGVSQTTVCNIKRGRWIRPGRWRSAYSGEGA